MKTSLTAALLLATSLLVVAPARAATEPPVPVRTAAPDYPDDMKRDGVSGIVMVKCTIDAQGNVTTSIIEKSSNAAFEKPALDALKKWKFKPARADGNPVEVTVSIPIKFVAEA